MSNNTPHASTELRSEPASAPAGSLTCKDVTDHDLENAEKVGPVKWRCPKCHADISLAYVLWCATEEWVRKEK